MSMRQEAQRQENSNKFELGGLRQYARLLHDELKRRYPRPDRIERYKAEIARLKGHDRAVPEL